METSGSDERGCARGENQLRSGADEIVTLAGHKKPDLLGREDLGGDRRSTTERAQPVAQRAMFGSGGLRSGGESRVVVGVLVHRRRGILIDVVGRVPAAQRARQDEDD